MEDPNTRLQNHKILLVEDDEFLNEMYAVRFTQAGFTFDSAKDGIEGLEKATTMKPDLMLIDLIMPKMDGYTLLEKMRQNPDLKDTKVIIFTNVFPTEGIEKVAKFGVVDYILKSDMSATNIVDKVSKLLHK